MTTVVSRKELGDAITFASLALPKRPVLPVLGGMRVDVSAGTVTFAAFDYEVSARVTVTGEGSGDPAGTLVYGAELAAAVKSLPKGRKNTTAELDVSEAGVTVRCDGVEVFAAALPAEAQAEYPQLPDLPDEAGVVDAAAFARSVARVTAAAGRDDTLPALTCVQLSSGLGVLELAATDRYRLAVDRLGWNGEDSDDIALLPAVILAKYAKSADKTGKVSLHFGGVSGYEFAGFSDGTRTLTTRTNPGTFPKYRRLVPSTDAATTVTADAGTLRAAVDRAGKLTARGERTGFAVADGQVTVTATRDGQVTATQRVPADVDGPDVETGFNAVYLASVLAGFDGRVRIGLQSAAKPALLTAEGDTFKAVVMPIRLAEAEPAAAPQEDAEDTAA